jgi:hypothetical protein
MEDGVGLQPALRALGRFGGEVPTKVCHVGKMQAASAELAVAIALEEFFANRCWALESAAIGIVPPRTVSADPPRP